MVWEHGMGSAGLQESFDLVDKQIEQLRKDDKNSGLFPLHTVVGYYQFERMLDEPVDPLLFPLARNMRWFSDDDGGWIALSCCLGEVWEFPHFLQEAREKKEVDVDEKVDTYFCVEVHDSVQVNCLAMQIGEEVYNNLKRESACAGEFLYKFAQSFFSSASSRGLISFVVKQKDNAPRHSFFCFGPVGWNFDAYPQERWPRFMEDTV
jgi:hypothetical protein